MSYISAIRKNEDVIVWERTEQGRELLTYRAPYYFFVEDPNGEHESIFGDKLTKLEFSTYNEYQQARRQCESDRIPLYESDLPPELKLLSEKYYQVPAPPLTVTMLDIEVDYNTDIGFASVENPYAPINSVALYHQHEHRMVLLAVPPEDQHWTEEGLKDAMNEVEELPSDVEVEVYLCQNEKELLLFLLAEIENSDLITGWNSDFFDVPYIAKRIERSLGAKFFAKLSFDFAPKPRYRSVEKFGNENWTIDLYGRISCDMLALFQKYEQAERPTYKLEAIADEVLPELPKLEYEGSLAQLYRKDFPWFARYNIRDTEVLKGFEEKLGYVALANEMYHLSTGLFKHVGGTLKLAELAINNYCIHELNQRVPDMEEPDQDVGSIVGAFVLIPQVGLHERIGSIDINSLYPSAIRSINISPEKIIGQFAETTVASEEIGKDSMVDLCLRYEDGDTETHTATEWRDICKRKKWAVSGYGTVFNQDEEGIIPSILRIWYTTRKEYQKLMREEKDPTKRSYYDRLQYVYKIKLNSLYGALNNAYFRYFDTRMGESTTGTGRLILLHQCAKANEALDGEYASPDIKRLENRSVGGPRQEREHFGYSNKYSVLYGDTDSAYFATHAESDEQAIQVADYISEIVNDSFQGFMQQRFLCQPKFDNLIRCGREIVASRGIFVDKKRYILNVIDDEGKRVDKLKVMGLDTKKTTIPVIVGKALNDFIRRLLKGEEWDSIAKDIVEYKEWVRTTDQIMDIGLPRAVSKVEEYTTKWKTDKTTRLPGHVAAAIHYNQLLEEYNDRESLPIVSGMKIKVFYLTQKYGQFHSIAIPTDMVKPPEWFLEHYTVNRDMHIERLVDKPLGNIIKAIGRDVPTAQSLIVEDLLGF